jgi:hypothetical protein
VIWAYAICDQPALPLPRRRGLAHAPLEAIVEGALVAVVSRPTHAPGEPALDALWAHERVVERLMADRAVLPLRFGTKLADRQAMIAALAARRDEFAAALGRVRNRVELGVRAMGVGGNDHVSTVAAPLAPPPAAPTGREYLIGKLARGHRYEQEAAALHEPLAALAAESRRSRLQSEDELLRAAYLVGRADVARFRARVERLQAAHRDVAILCTGPWPPYSFVGASAADAVAEGILS